MLPFVCSTLVPSILGRRGRLQFVFAGREHPKRGVLDSRAGRPADLCFQKGVLSRRRISQMRAF